MSREYKTIQALRAGGVVEIEGVKFKASEDQEIKEGDWYIAERNTGPHLLTCKSRNYDEGWIVPIEPRYSFNTSECVRVEEVVE